MQPIIVAYDISENKTRRRVLKVLKGWRLDGQKSVHECRLGLRAAEELFVQLSEPLDPATDSLIMAWLDGSRRPLARGIGRPALNDHFWHIG